MSVSEVMSGLRPIGLAMMMLGTGCESVTVVPMPEVDAGLGIDIGVDGAVGDAAVNLDAGPMEPDAGADPTNIRTPGGLALRECQRIARCTPLVYAEHYGTPGNEGTDLSPCVEARQEAYLDGPLSWQAQGTVGAIPDPEACQDALDDCTTFRLSQFVIERWSDVLEEGPSLVPACRRNPGLVPNGEPCSASAECGDGLYCAADDGRRPSGCTGRCQPVLTESSSCADFEVDPCDTRAGQYCVAVLGGGFSFEPRCERVDRVGEGELCGRDDRIQCEPSLQCRGGIAGRCEPFFGEGDSCLRTMGRCDEHQGFSCRSNADQTDLTCQAPRVAEIGEICGFVTERVDGRPVQVEVDCPSDVAYCDDGVLPFRCAHRRRAGEACDDDTPCRAPFACIQGDDGRRCRLPDPVCG